jgi:hypothetical protein
LIAHKFKQKVSNFYKNSHLVNHLNFWYVTTLLGTTFFSPPLASSFFPPFLLLAAADQERGKPQVSLGLRGGLGPEGCRAWSNGQGHGHGGAPWLVGEAGAPMWWRGSGWRRHFRHGSRRVEGSFPLGRPRGEHTGAPWLHVRASRWLGRPIAREPRAGAVRCGAGGKVKKKKEERLTRGSHTSARELEKEKAQVVGLSC